MRFPIVCLVALLFFYTTSQSSSIVDNHNSKLDMQSYRYVSKILNRYVNGFCSTNLRPDYAVVVGGVTSVNIDAKLALDGLEERVTGLRLIAKKYGAKILLLERIRAIKSMRPQSTYIQNLQKGSNKPQFVFMQRFEVRVGLNKKIDNLTVELIKSGMNVFGKRFNRFKRVGVSPQVVVYYRLEDPIKTLNKIKLQCIKNAFENWCLNNFSTKEKAECSQVLNKLQHYFTASSIRFTIGPFMLENGKLSSVYLNFPWNIEQLRKLEFISNVDIPVSGRVNLRMNKRHQ